MQTIKIPSLDDELIARIKIQARNNDLTLEEEIREFIIRHCRTVGKSDEY